MAQPWLQSLELVSHPDLVISSPDETLSDIAPILNRVVGIDLDTGADVRKLNAAMATGNEAGSITGGDESGGRV